MSTSCLFLNKNLEPIVSQFTVKKNCIRTYGGYFEKS